MGLTRTQVSQLYVILLGRASEGNGNTYWMTNQPNMTATANVMLDCDAAKSYFGTTLIDNQAFIEHIYLNSFGKTYSQDKTGIDYWLVELNSGKSRGEIVNALIVAAQDPSNAGAAQDQFNNRVEVSDYTASKIAKVADLAIFKGFIDSVTDNDATVTAAKTIVDEKSITLDGVLSDGLIKGATIFADANGDGVWNPGEATTTTDHLGNFTLKNAEGPLVASGGTDISTGLAFEGTFCAPEGSTVITPITTLIDQVMQSATNSETGEPLTADEAMALVAVALGLSPDIDLLAFDPMATIADKTATAADLATAVDVQTVSVQIANMIGQAAAMLDGAGVTTEENGAVSAAAALATMIAQATGAIDLTSTATIETFLEHSATRADATAEQIAAVKIVIADIATATASVNGAMADAAAGMEEGTSPEDIFTNLAQTQVAAEDIEDLIESGTKIGDAGSAMESSESGSLAAAIQGAADDVTAAKKVAKEEAIASDKEDNDDAGAGGGGGGGGIVIPSKNIAISATDTTKAEGDSGTTAFTFTVTRSGGATGTTSVNYAVTGSGGDQADAADFGGALPSGTVNFANGEASKLVTVNVAGDTAVEADEGFIVTISNPANSETITTSSAIGTIQNDDTGLAIAATDAAKAEGNTGDTEFTFTVIRSGDATGATSADYAVKGSGGYTAKAADFGGTLPFGTVTFADGETLKSIIVNVAGNTVIEADKGFTVTISNPGNSETITTSSAVGTIENDDNSLSLSDLDDSNGFTINGIGENDLSGYSVSSAGDVNGDGFDDLIIGAPTQSGAGRESGEAYVVYGGAYGVKGWIRAGNSFDLSGLNGTNGFTLTGIDAGDYCGYSVSSAGDVNGDEFDDIIIGAYYADSGGESRAGESYLVFGSGSHEAVVDLSDLGTDGFILSGADERDWSGYSVSSAGDVNGDGLDDFIIGAPLSDGPGSIDPDGEAYLVFGSISLAAGMDLSNLSTSDGLTLLAGAESWDNAGYSVSTAGDFNGDGFDDLLIGAKEAKVEGEDGAGRAYLIYGGSDISGDIDLATNADITINGINKNDWAGYSVSSAGDINGDGFDDIIIGAPGTDDPGTTNGVGESYVIFGKNPAATLNLSVLNSADGFSLKGISAGDSSGQAVSAAGDINADGYDDMIIGAKNAGAGAGESYVVFGGEFGVNSWESPTSDLDLDLDLNGTMGFTLTGIDYLDNSGCSVSAAGDINGDGFDDLIIGAHNVDQAGANLAGESYVIYGDNFTGNATAGTAGDDIMTGTADADNLVGGLGNDTLNGNGGTDVLYGGAGDDLISISDISFFKLKGGTGTDTLKLADGLDLDLTTISDNKISGIEKIDLSGTANELTLNIHDVLNISDTTNTLLISGETDDVVNMVNIDGGIWAEVIGGEVTDGVEIYSVYLSGVATLQVDSHIIINIMNPLL